VAKDLIIEIKKLIEFYGMQGADRQVNRMIVSGGSSNVKNLVPLLSKELNLPVEKLNPFIGITGAEGVPEEYHATLGVAVGLAMRRPGDVK
jgi:Tfp pilus assembly PilM family ATPase